VEFDPVLEMVMAEARDDGCLLIPFEETSQASMANGHVPDLLE